MTILDHEVDHIVSVAKFLEIMDKHFYDTSSKWMYRGLKKYDYKLKPSIGRLLGNENFQSLEKLLDFEKSAFNEFRIETFKDLRVNNQFILLAVAQHHGLNTRLLDWTLSPLIALFFAVEDSETFDIDGALCSFQTQFVFNDFGEIQSPFDKKLDEYHFLSSPDLSPRIRAQQGVFQLFKNPTIEFENAYNLAKLRIPAKNKRNIKRELNNLGISYKTLFPDFDGICKSINYDKLCKEIKSQ